MQKASGSSDIFPVTATNRRNPECVARNVYRRGETRQLSLTLELRQAGSHLGADPERAADTYDQQNGHHEPEDFPKPAHEASLALPLCKSCTREVA
jgi:hypothetical protein